MELTKLETAILATTVWINVGEKEITKKYSEMQLELLEKEFDDLIGNTTPNELVNATNSVIDKVLEVFLNGKSEGEYPTLNKKY